MICGHCQIAFHENSKLVGLLKDSNFLWSYCQQECPQCGNINIQFYAAKFVRGFIPRGNEDLSEATQLPVLIFRYPNSTGRKPCPVEVPSNIAKDYSQACNVLIHSPEASAALSRRCLQGILRDKGFQQKELSQQIQVAIDSGQLPTYIRSLIDAVRNTGNFAAHLMKLRRVHLLHLSS